MKEMFEIVSRWHESGHRLAMATVVSTWKSSPRPNGSVMVIRDDGQVWGSVSGGCVESAVIESGQRVLETELPETLSFAGATEQVFEVGLSCGGKISVFVEPCPVASLEWKQAMALSRSGSAYVWGTRLSEPYGHFVFESGVGSDAVKAAFESRCNQIAEIDGQEVFLSVRRAPEKLIIVGGVHIAIPLISMARAIGFHTIVVDPRAAFMDVERFESAPDLLLCEWPGTAFDKVGLDDDCYVVVLTHDPKIDDLALRLLLNSDVKYIGALGSRTTQSHRRETFLKEGFAEEQISRIHGPVGLSIGALTPEEIAISIAAQLVQARRA